uniref:Uncharacterized protein n=1 Tax=Pseudonaja textilis TaxID=8673 RepID=A0A670XSH4_PSETE
MVESMAERKIEEVKTYIRLFFYSHTEMTNLDHISREGGKEEVLLVKDAYLYICRTMILFWKKIHDFVDCSLFLLYLHQREVMGKILKHILQLTGKLYST